MKARWLLILPLALVAVAAHAQEPGTADPSGEVPTPPAEPATAPALTQDPTLVPPPEASSAPAAEDIELSAAELAELGLAGGGGAGEQAFDSALKLYGFMDFNVVGFVNKRDSVWRGATQRHPAFFMGSFNLYLSKNLTESIRTFGEVRFSYMPAGTPIPTSPRGEFVTTGAADYADYGRTARWGGIEIERVYLEWSMHQLLALRVGQFLTPYGIWNVDHGSPTIIPFARPFIIGLNLMPERQTGFELFGRAQVSGHSAVGYHLTLSNGGGPISEFKDLDGNKAVGGRIYFDNDSFGALRIGGSIYYGRDTNATEIAGVNAQGKLAFTQNIVNQFDSLGLAADIQWKYRGFHLQSELISQQVRYTENGRVGAVNPSAGAFLAPPDVNNWGVYGLGGYRFEWLGVMPYLIVDHTFHVDPFTLTRLFMNGLSAGLNIRPVESVVLKIEYRQVNFPDGFALSDSSIRMVQSQLAWAF